MKRFLKAIWLFCSQVFIPQWGKHPQDYGQDGYLEEQLTKQRERTESLSQWFCDILRLRELVTEWPLSVLCGEYFSLFLEDFNIVIRYENL